MQRIIMLSGFLLFVGVFGWMLHATGTTVASISFRGSSATATTRPLPSPTPLPPPVSWLKRTTLLTIYGRSFGNAPILGQLGSDNSFADLTRQVQPYLAGIRANNGGRQTRVGVHLIYALATPCDAARNCLLYLDDTGVNIVKQYIEPAARRGWLVILDDQLGLSNPVAEVRHMISRGLLRYDNVEVALDPEFRAAPGQTTPGIPVGTVTAAEINQAQYVLNNYLKSIHPRHHKLMMVHQFQVGMIQDRTQLRENFRDIDPVIIADGFGPPNIKVHVYHDLLSHSLSRKIRWRGIKLFYPNPYEQAGHGDNPLMTWRQVFGHEPIYDGGIPYRINPMPNVIIIA